MLSPNGKIRFTNIIYQTWAGNHQSGTKKLAANENENYYRRCR